MPAAIEWWYCCIHPREQGVLRTTIMGIAETLNVGIPVPLWDAFWLSYSPSGLAMRSAFLSIYGLEIVTIVVDPELPPIDVVRAKDALRYAAWFVFLLSPAAACTEGCQQSKLPYQD